MIDEPTSQLLRDPHQQTFYLWIDEFSYRAGSQVDQMVTMLAPEGTKARSTVPERVALDHALRRKHLQSLVNRRPRHAAVTLGEASVQIGEVQVIPGF